MPPPPPSRKAVVITLAGMVAVGAGITALVIADRASKPATQHVSAGAAHDDASSEDVAPVKQSAPPSSDPWAGSPPPATPDHWASSGLPDGSKLAVGQGVEVVMPPGFRTDVQSGITVGFDNRGIMIAAGPITAETNDPQQLAQIHARTNGLVFESMQQIFVGGVQRPMAIFHGSFGGVAVRHVAVPLIAPGYRVAVMFQAPVQLMSDTAIQAMVLELYTRRIVLP
jgi:hypothetical protein